MYSFMELESGDGTGRRLRVNSAHSGSVAPGDSFSVHGSAQVANGASTVIVDELDPEAGVRTAIQIQNLSDSYPVHINLGGSAGTNDLRIDPGNIYMFPANVVYSGKIEGLGNGGSALVTFIEFYVSP